MQKTTTEILNETAKAYTLNTRSHMVGSGGCAYITPEGRKCGLGRCLTDEALAILVKDEHNTGFGSTELDEAYGLDNLLKDEYKGYSGAFWTDIQYLHDNPNNWDETGLSEQGKFKVIGLIDIWA